MKRQILAGNFLASPWIVTFLAFWLFPLVYSFFLGFTDFRLMRPDYNWVGWDNYINLFQDKAFIEALINTFIFVIGTIPFTTVAPRHLDGIFRFGAAFHHGDGYLDVGRLLHVDISRRTEGDTGRVVRSGIDRRSQRPSKVPAYYSTATESGYCLYHSYQQHKIISGLY